MVIENRKENEMNRTIKERCCDMLNDFARRYDITIELEEKEKTLNGIELRIRDNYALWQTKYLMVNWDIGDLSRIIEDLMAKYNLRARADRFDETIACVICNKYFEPKAPKPVPYVPKIKNVIFNEPATIIFWSDGSKTVVKCQEGEGYDPEKGMAMAISKKALGNMGNYCEVFKKWLPEEEVETERDPIGVFERFKKAMDGLGFTVEVVKEELENSTSGEKNK